MTAVLWQMIDTAVVCCSVMSVLSAVHVELLFSEHHVVLCALQLLYQTWQRLPMMSLQAITMMLWQATTMMLALGYC